MPLVHAIPERISLSPGQVSDAAGRRSSLSQPLHPWTMHGPCTAPPLPRPVAGAGPARPKGVKESDLIDGRGALTVSSHDAPAPCVASRTLSSDHQLLKQARAPVPPDPDAIDLSTVIACGLRDLVPAAPEAFSRSSGRPHQARSHGCLLCRVINQKPTGPVTGGAACSLEGF